MAASIKALQQWCKQQCEGYRDVDITNMTTSFKDGLAFCAIIHRHRPELLDFNSLSKENIYENNNLAFRVAEEMLGIPALLDAEDMVALRVPDRLSILTYVSQYYNFFHGRSPIGGMAGIKRTAPDSEECNVKKEIPEPKKPAFSKVAVSQPAPSLPTPNKPVTAVSAVSPRVLAESTNKQGTLSSTCAICHNHVHLVQRHLVDGKLYHRNCFRCKQCSSTLLSGTYKHGSEPGTFLCVSHQNKHGSGTFSAEKFRTAASPAESKPGPIVQENQNRTPVPQPRTVLPDLQQKKLGAGTHITENSHNVSTTSGSTAVLTKPEQNRTPVPEPRTFLFSIQQNKTAVSTHSPSNVQSIPVPAKITSDPVVSLNQNHMGPAVSSNITVGTFQGSAEPKKSSAETTYQKKISPSKQSPSFNLSPAPESGLNQTTTSANKLLSPTAEKTQNARAKFFQDMNVTPAKAEEKSQWTKDTPKSSDLQSSSTDKDKARNFLMRNLPTDEKSNFVRSVTPSSKSSGDSKHSDVRRSLMLPSSPTSKPVKESPSSFEGKSGIQATREPAQAPPRIESSKSESPADWRSRLKHVDKGPSPSERLSDAKTRQSPVRTPEVKKEDSSGRSAVKSPDFKETVNITLKPAVVNDKRTEPLKVVVSNDKGTAVLKPTVLNDKGEVLLKVTLPSDKGGGVVKPVVPHGSVTVPKKQDVSNDKELVSAKPVALNDKGSTVSPPATKTVANDKGTVSSPATKPKANDKGTVPSPATKTSLDIPAPKESSPKSGTPQRKKLSAAGLDGFLGLPDEKPANTVEKSSPKKITTVGKPETPDRISWITDNGHLDKNTGTPDNSIYSNWDADYNIKSPKGRTDYITEEEIQRQLKEIEDNLDSLERKGVELEQQLRGCEGDEPDDSLMCDWFRLIHDKQLLMRKESELIYISKQQALEDEQEDVQDELRRLMDLPEDRKTEAQKLREKQLLDQYLEIVEGRNAIVEGLDEDRLREEEEDRVIKQMIQNLDASKDSPGENKKKKAKKFSFRKMLKSPE
ncbi:MICAL-like protein 2 isoform X2 [Protopterus annectens]|uniref:MICAL-like protein 2 isoform X2 n=1 Tax=Protopterus annectens TaxID=7888 RepID=UPI001CF9888C|nr:MICAL-like protein 2 isoform X2 [Protopterus annectens]